MAKKQYVVIGLGRFGSSVAKTLYGLGNEVLAIDSDEGAIHEIADNVTHAVQLDAVDEGSLKSIGIRNFDVAVVAIGSNIQASIMVTLLLKELGIKHVIAKAHDEMHARILYKTGADRVVLPEKEMGVRVAHNLASSNILDIINLSPDYCIAEIVSPKEWHGHTLRDLEMRSRYGINVMVIKRDNDMNISPSADDVIQEGDIIVAIGGTVELNQLTKEITN